ncbi:MAG: tRNA dihydrouridine synthase DusB [Candidatus Tantalella remota]|nr:tRNA dihydrouridine synthase DusB [Candidatus Tantalella remota]
MKKKTANEIQETNYEITNRDAIRQMIAAKAVLAPMSGITDVPFRMICRKFGCSFAFTEMVDVNGIVYNNKKTFKYLERLPGDHPLGAQLVGQDEERLLRVARLCEEVGFGMVDLNAGCPARKVITGGKGAYLLKTPGKIGRLIARMVKGLAIPVTIKIRSGWDEDSLNYLEVARIAEAEGASAICIHPRTKTQMYRGQAYHEMTQEVKESVRIPVFASGNMFKASDVKTVMEDTGCDGVYIARGALGRPWIFDEINRMFQGKDAKDAPDLDRIKEVVEEHYRLSLEHHGEFLGNKRMHKHLSWYLKEYKNLNEMLNEYRETKDLDSFLVFLKRLSLDGRKLYLK